MAAPARSLRWLVVLASAATATASPGCDPPYEPPCKVTTRHVLAEDPAIQARPAIALARTGERAVASWIRRDSPDAGAPADASAGGPSPITAFEVAVIDASGSVTSRATVPTPEPLRARKDGVADVGVVPVDGAHVVHWTETTITTAPDGRRRTASVVKASRVTRGVAAEATTLHACETCITRSAFVPVGAGVLAIVRIDPDLAPGTLGTPSQSRFALVRLRDDGSTVAEPAPWLVLPPPEVQIGGMGGSRMTTAPERHPNVVVSTSGRIAVTAGGRAWLTDDALRLVAGPILLPRTADARVAWTPSGEATVAWSMSPLEDGRTDDEAVPREVFTGTVPFGSAEVASRERASRGRTTLAFDRDDDDLGVLFESAGRTLFASVDSRGKKRGGDVVLAVSTSANQSEYGSVDIPGAHALFARGDHRFTVVALGAGELVATEVVCAP